ncbi:ABC transporter permease [Nibrella saemangeumensis]|uniref:ABC transporter permease n=1 Tax=Nibrella saemangeumensis TaxID=1084526 RepID=A0ABP8NQL2_9BACT
MFTNFFKTAYRNLFKNKFFTVLNIIGLALGMSTSLLFVALLTFLFRFDEFHPHRDRIYRVTTQVYDNVENPHYASAPVGLAQKLKDEFTGVDKVVRIHRSLGGDAIYQEKKIPLYGYFADPEFLDVFNFSLLHGNKATALTKPNTVVITETEAMKLFGSTDALGEVIRMEPYGDLVITGILKDVPENSHMRFDAIASYATFLSYKGASFLADEQGWQSFANSYVYFLLAEGAEPATIGHLLDETARQRYTKKDNKTAFRLQALTEIVPGPQLYDSLGQTWSFLGLFIIGSITLVILIPACSNYANLSISQSLERMKEIGVRKVMGGQKKQLFLQFIVESTIIVLLALLLSYPIFELIRGDFLYQMVETEPLDLSPTPATFIGFFLFAILVGIAAGIVPALYFSKISPINALKGKEIKTSRRSYFRRIVLTTQFVLSLGFIMAVVIMMRQYQYSIHYDFGFEQQQVLDVELKNVDAQRFKNEYGKLSSVQRITLSSHILGISSAPERPVRLAHQADSLAASSISVDEGFIATMKLALLAGRDFSNKAAENARLIIVNEDFVKKLNLKDPFAAIDRMFVLPDGREVRIAGVLKNFHYAGLKEAIKPFYFDYDPARFKYANVKLVSKEVVGDLPAMEALWKKIGGDGEFSAQLFSEEIKEAYSFYIMIMKLWGFLGVLAITVACLGLLGTVSFTTKKRVKEISIRKVMGATSESLVLLLSKEFIILMVIASVITVPVIYVLFNYLLATVQHYRIEIGFIEIIISLLIMMVLGLSTILSQTLKAANANPVDNLSVSS